MMFSRLRSVHKDQAGFTLLEFIMALTISVIIAGTITATIFQVVTSTGRTNNHMIAVRQAQQAGFEVSCDVQQARVVTLADEAVDNPDGTRFPLVLSWTNWDGVSNTVTYTLEGTELWRDDGERDRIAEFINPDPAKTNCDFTDGKLTLTVTASVGSGLQVQDETRIYEIVPRPSW